MKTSELLITIRDVLVNDSALQTWAQATYSRPVQVWLGINVRNMPGETVYPVIMLGRVNRDRLGDMTHRATWQVHIAAVVKDEIATEGTNTITYPGYVNVQDMQELIETVIKHAGLGQVDIEVEDVNDGPNYVSHMIIHVEKIQTPNRR